jgi:hypothetical protein
MSKTAALRVLSSFIYGDENIPHRRMGRDNRWFHGFTKSLVRHGLSLSALDIAFVPAPQTDAAMAALSARFEAENVTLVICPGTDAVVRWARANGRIATLYFGAHPENNGLEIVEQPNIGGVRLNLPLVWNVKNFSLLKELMPELDRIYVPLNLTSEFAFPNVRANFRLFRRLRQGFWIPDQSTYIGHRSLNMLASAIGCSFHEGPYMDCAELARGLDEIPDDGRSAVVGFNDTALMDGAVNAILHAAGARRLALFWVNNPPIVKAGGVADFSSDFEQVGRVLGDMAVRILQGADMAEIALAPDPGERFTLNLNRCRDLGIAVTDAVRGRFHAVIA